MKKELNPIIYKTTNLINGKIYVGQDRYNNQRYLGSGRLLKESIKKHGIENFKKEVLEYCSLENLNEREAFWIAELNSASSSVGYNLTSGGTQRYELSEESRQLIRDKRALQDMSHMCKPQSQEVKDKISSSQRGKIRTPEFKDRLSKYWKGKKFSEETKRKISESLKGKGKGRVPWNKGIPMSEEQKLKISETKINR
jgi:group I intron endonuclease